MTHKTAYRMVGLLYEMRELLLPALANNRTLGPTGPARASPLE